MGYKCDECDSTFREMKNLQQHRRKRHGLKKYKCDQCNFRSNDQTNVVRHEKTTHNIYKCEQCEYTAYEKFI